MMRYQLGNFVTVGKIDMDGLQGRDPHPPADLEDAHGIVSGYHSSESYGPGEDEVVELYNVYVVTSNHPPGVYVLADYELTRVEDPTEREVRLEEEQARDETERAALRGITAPDF